MSDSGCKCDSKNWGKSPAYDFDQRYAADLDAKAKGIPKIPKNFWTEATAAGVAKRRHEDLIEAQEAEEEIAELLGLGEIEERSKAYRKKVEERFNASVKELAAYQKKEAEKALDVQVGGQHYKNMVIQPVEFIQKNQLPYCEAAVIKYVCRHRGKNGKEDIAKAAHFLDLLLEIEYDQVPKKRYSDLDDYQGMAADTAVYPTLGHPIVYPALGLAGEAGEVAEKVKKMCRDDGLELTEERQQALKKELGDVLWYVSEVARQAGLSLSEVATENVRKLTERASKGTLNGSGDNR